MKFLTVPLKITSFHRRNIELLVDEDLYDLLVRYNRRFAKYGTALIHVISGYLMMEQ